MKTFDTGDAQARVFYGNEFAQMDRPICNDGTWNRYIETTDTVTGGPFCEKIQCPDVTAPGTRPEMMEYYAYGTVVAADGTITTDPQTEFGDHERGAFTRINCGQPDGVLVKTTADEPTINLSNQAYTEYAPYDTSALWSPVFHYTQRDPGARYGFRVELDADLSEWEASYRVCVENYTGPMGPCGATVDPNYPLTDTQISQGLELTEHHHIQP